MTTDERLDELTRSMKAIEGYLLQFRAEVTERLQIIENRLDTISSVMMSLDSRLQPITKAVLDFGSVATRLTRDHARLEEKVSKLVDPAA
jgi:hypothetical protein